ncbi:transketolase [soil metagenome]
MDERCVNTIRGLALDAVEQAKSGHAGLPLGAAPMAWVLWSRFLKFDPKDPKWFDRDRFILSAGHGSMLLYSLLYLTGYDLPLAELKRFRQLHSKTPGHPENILTPGVEMATGPLGQGIAHSVGMAIAEKFLSATYNKAGRDVVDHRTYAICSDGDLMEGVSGEAASLAGHLKLGKLIWLYDDNGISIDGKTEITFTDNTELRFKGYGWHVIRIDGEDMAEVDRAIREAQAEMYKPTLIMAKTVIGYGSPHLAGTSKAHSNPFGTEELALTKTALGISQEPFHIDEDVQAHFREVGAKGTVTHADWLKDFNAYEDGSQFRNAVAGELGKEWLEKLPTITDKVATRKASEIVINAISDSLPNLIGGSADLAESNLTTQKGLGFFEPDDAIGKNIHFGVREFGMTCAVNAINLHGGTRGYGGSFLVFSDYARPALRLAALMECPSIFIFTHDSVGVGEDGPTHEPVEQITSLRAIPNFNVFRPADGNETVVAWKVALQSKKTPTLLALSRQALPPISPDDVRNHPAEKGGYVLREASAEPKVILIGTGSEVQHCVKARETLEAEGIATRVVSLPSWFLFEKQDDAYKASVLPAGVPRVSIEAGTTLAWPRYAEVNLGIDTFGLSAPGDEVMKEFGMTPEAVVAAARKVVKGN